MTMTGEQQHFVIVRMKLRATLATENRDVNSFPRSESTKVMRLNDELVHSGYPTYNGIGAIFFTKWLWRTLEVGGLAKIYDDLSGWGKAGHMVNGEMNDLFACFTVSDIPRAIAIIKAALEEENLLRYSEIGWWDNREGIFRTAYPEKSNLCFMRHFTGAILCPVTEA